MNSVISCSVLVAGIVGNALGDRRILEPPPGQLIGSFKIGVRTGSLADHRG